MIVIIYSTTQVVGESRAAFKVTPQSLRMEEIRMEGEMLELLRKWDKDLLDILDNYSVQGDVSFHVGSFTLTRYSQNLGANPRKITLNIRNFAELLHCLYRRLA